MLTHTCTYILQIIGLRHQHYLLMILWLSNLASTPAWMFSLLFWTGATDVADVRLDGLTAYEVVNTRHLSCMSTAYSPDVWGRLGCETHSQEGLSLRGGGIRVCILPRGLH